MKRIGRLSIVCIVIMMCLSCHTVCAKSVKMYNFLGCKNSITGYVTKGKLTSRKMTIYGSISRVKNRHKSNESFKRLAKKKRVFKVSPKCKYYVGSVYGWKKISGKVAKNYFRIVVKNNVNGVTMHIKKGRIIRIDFET